VTYKLAKKDSVPWSSFFPFLEILLMTLYVLCHPAVAVEQGAFSHLSFMLPMAEHFKF